MKSDKLVFSLIIISVFSIALVSGCVGQSNISTGVNGLVIRDLYTEPPEDLIKVGEPIIIFFSVENTGAFRAKNVFVELSGANWAPSEATRFFIGDINPPDPSIGSPGGLKPVVLRVPTPIVPEGTTVRYPLKIRVTYGYGSSASVVIPAYSQQRYQRDLQSGKQIQTSISSLNVQQATLPTPIRVSMTGPDRIVVPPYPYEEYSYHITFTNVGDGVPITANVDGLINGGVWVTGPGAYFKNCLGARTDYFAQDSYWSTPAGINTIQDMWQFYYENKNTRAVVRYDDNNWGYAFDFVGNNFAVGINAVNSFVNRPTILDWEFLGEHIEPIKLRTGTRSVTRPCTIVIDNQATGGWQQRETDTLTVNFDLRYTYFIEKDFDVAVTAPIIKNPGRP